MHTMVSSMHCSTLKLHCVYLLLSLPTTLRSTGFILEGFPSNGDELQLLCNKGLFPDAAVFLHVESKHIVERMLPGKMEIWKRKRNKLLEKKALAKEKKIKEWVCMRRYNVHVHCNWLHSRPKVAAFTIHEGIIINHASNLVLSMLQYVTLNNNFRFALLNVHVKTKNVIVVKHSSNVLIVFIQWNVLFSLPN